MREEPREQPGFQYCRASDPFRRIYVKFSLTTPDTTRLLVIRTVTAAAELPANCRPARAAP